MENVLFQPRSNSFKINIDSGHQKKALDRQTVNKQEPWELKASDPVLTHFIGHSLTKIMKYKTLRMGF